MNDHANNDLLKDLMEQANRIVLYYDIEANSITYLNNSFSKITQQEKAKYLTNPQSLLELIHPDDDNYLHEVYKEFLQSRTIQDLEVRIVLPDKTTRWVLLNAVIAEDEKGKQQVVAMADDITVIKDNYDSLEKFGAKKNSILEILSHELAGPLANINVLTEILSETTESYKNEELNTVIHIIKETSERGVHMIREFVKQEFLESSHVELYLQREEIVARFREIIEQYKEGEKQIAKQFILTSSCEKIYANIDKNKFMQVINNLVSNSIKFTPDNGVISIDLKDNEDNLLITVKDNGIGIPKKYHAELFDKFTRARRPGLRGEPSTGLGMSIIKTIVEWHKGRIWFESEENAGTTFYIEIPKE